MSVFDSYFLPAEEKLRRRILVDSTLYSKLAEQVKKYDNASINKLVNIAIIELIKSENVQLYEKSDDEIVEGHNFDIRVSSYQKLEELREKYGVSVFKLINIAIYNALNS